MINYYVSIAKFIEGRDFPQDPSKGTCSIGKVMSKTKTKGALCRREVGCLRLFLGTPNFGWLKRGVVCLFIGTPLLVGTPMFG